ncbi:aminopeptidase N [Devosia subaequoris]|uniref:Aminopeptidase N n=1 Tax=Devosia subaequoris TaxID=395930 RepID=A0A7W6IL81_9HYPH|nr:aminopeptidase N [Devosia subaequoris]MBB4051025.1 aminopeptidase N [Devosia subaequoris]MCP1208307.1 aminopeptidase N [Devosia subaequoris]
MRTESEQTIYLKDYAPTPYRIVSVELDFKILEESTRVRAQLTVEPREGTAPGTPLVLDGDELKLDSIALDGAPLMQSAYASDANSLTLVEPPHKRFVLETEVTLNPAANTKLMGLYRSSGTWCTQCEPEGFRRITYYLDRPDVLAPFKVRMSAPKSVAPVLLANGNLVDQGDLGEGMHFAVWEDPFLKPAYLFALVAGDLGSIKDSFTTMSGREVELGIYCTHGKEAECAYAMDSLIRSMAWDERRFGREYDLDVFNIVAVSDFNFGAMENKGLNIFNDRLVFAKPETATDANYHGIERVIAHEYFHNWTGNRITCRDWFQLCLKEGLTVFRDQEFTSDERSRPVQRIHDVQNLRTSQFPEDGGPLAHPPRPDNYREINNFYTTTVYQKGAEIVRMLATMLGEAGFRKAMDLYFERHDGDATTIEAFIKVFEDSSGRNLSQFATWYLQAGTPQVKVSDSYDAASQSYTLTLSQTNDPTPGEPTKKPLLIPVRFGLIGPNGSPLGWTGVSGGTVEDDLILFDSDSATLTFEGVANKPVPSLFRGFSAPVKLSTNLSQDDLLFLARHDSDPFNRWDALQTASTTLIANAAQGKAWSEDDVDALRAALIDTLENGELDDAYKAQALDIPAETVVGRYIGKDVNPDAVAAARKGLVTALVSPVASKLASTYEALASSDAYSPNAAQAGRRSLRNGLLSLLTTGSDRGAALAANQFEVATNMTDRYAAMAISVRNWTSEASALLGAFRTRFAGDPLVFDKWLTASAQAPDEDVIDRMRATLAAPDFPKTNPNRLRSLLGSFVMANPVQFTRVDGAGFRFITEAVAEIDKVNPQVASRILTGFRVLPILEASRREAGMTALQALKEQHTLSRNVGEILDRILAG